MSNTTLVEVAANIVANRVGSNQLSSTDLLAEIHKVHAGLKNIAEGTLTVAPAAEPAQEEKPQISLKKAFGKKEVICMVCGKGGFKTLARHLSTAHGMKPSEYRKQFGIKATQSLAASSYSEERRTMAKDRGLADNLAKARAVRMANIEAKKNPKKNGKAAAGASANPAAAAGEHNVNPAPVKNTKIQKPAAAKPVKAAKTPKVSAGAVKAAKTPKAKSDAATK